MGKSMMYRNLLGAILLGVTGVFGADETRADESPVLVELFTSQGCSSCPPADALLHDLSKRDDVIALALHVDYWDYIGWKDKFALPGHTARQKAYASAAGRRMIYTPQMIINGTDHVVGTHPMDVAELIAIHDAKPAPVELTVTETDNGITIRATAATRLVAGVEVRLVRYMPEATVAIKRGENAGKTLTYRNVVQSWHDLGLWDGGAVFETHVTGDLPAVVIFQAENHGAILAAQKLN